MTAYRTFASVITHGQWLRAGVDGQVIWVDGNYLINYLKLQFDKTAIPALLDDINTIVSGWIQAYNQHRKRR